MRRGLIGLLTGVTLVTAGTAGTAAEQQQVVEPTATVRYVPTTIAGYNAAMRVGEIVVSQARPVSFDGSIEIRALRPQVSLSFDDLGAPMGAAIPVSVYVPGSSWSGAADCVRVGTPWTVSGFAVGAVLQIAVQGATDEYGNLISGSCSGRAMGGIMTASGAVWQPSGSGPAVSAYPAASGCSVSTHALLPRETATCTFTATKPGGWRVSYDGLGVHAGDYVTDVTVAVLRDRKRPPYGTTESRYTAECGSGLIHAGDRVTVTIRQYDSGYSQHTLHAGQGEHC